MTTSEERRHLMLDRIRSGVNDGVSQRARSAAVAARLAGQAPHLVPLRAKRDPAGLEALFAEHLVGQSATVVTVAGDAEIPSAIASYLRSQNLSTTLRVGEDPRLRNLPWSSAPSLTLQSGRAQSGDEVGLSHATAAVAETGTLIMASGAANPVTLNFLPENHVVVVRAGDIAGHYEAAFDKIRSLLGRAVMPRTLNFISGPSRSADIGGKPVLGAHGPRRLCVVIVRD